MGYTRDAPAATRYVDRTAVRTDACQFAARLSAPSRIRATFVRGARRFRVRRAHGDRRAAAAERTARAWSTRLHAVAWWHRATPAALGDADYRAALAPVPRSDLTFAAFVRYGETPAGDYHEILATPVVLLQAPMPAGTIPFIAVDSLASIVAGRANRALPKTLARFDRSNVVAHR
jgi:hypothetical protein